MPPITSQEHVFVVPDIRFQVHLCQMQMRQHQQALNTLQSIPAKQRTPRVHMALGKLLQDTGNSRGAIAAYKEVLKVSIMNMSVSQKKHMIKSSSE